MKLPSFIYGEYRQVKKHCAKRLADIRRGAKWSELPYGDWIDTADTPGLFVLEGPVREFSSKPHFCCFAFTVEVRAQWTNDKLPDAFWESLYEAGCEHLWVFLGLLGQHSIMFLHKNPAWLRPYLEAAVRFWPALDAEGERYTFGRMQPTSLWRLPTNIGFVLARLGVPTEVLNAPLPAGGLPELVAPFVSVNT